MACRPPPLTWSLSPVRRPSSLDAYVFGHLAPILRCKLPSGKLQQHLKTLDNLSSFCSNVLLLYFPRDPGELPLPSPPPHPPNPVPLPPSPVCCPLCSGSGAQKTSSPPPEAPDAEQLPHKRRKQLLSALVALGAMLSYALLTGMLSIQHLQQEELGAPGPGGLGGEEEEEGDG